MRQAGMEPDAWQREAFESGARQQLWLCHRQAGKSSTAGALAWEMAQNTPRSLTLLLSRTLRQSGELFYKVRNFYHAAGDPIPLTRHTALSLETVNGSRIVSLPAHPDTVVGYSAPDLVIIDEAARVPDELYYVIRPMMAMSAGKLIALSTPWGKRGWFHEAWTGVAEEDAALDLATVQALLADLGMTVTEDDLEQETVQDFSWHKVELAAPANPRLGKRFLANERRSVPDLIFRSEWLCEFTDPEGSVFRYDDVMAMLSDDIEPMWGDPRKVPTAVSKDVTALFEE